MGYLYMLGTQGRLLRIDDVTINKDRMDFARFLVATSELKELNVVVKFLIDGRVFPIHFIEKLKFGFTEDACLVEFEADNKFECSTPDCMQEEEPLVDALVQQLKDDWIRNSNEDKGDVGDPDNHQSIQGEVEQNVVKENSCSNRNKPSTVSINGDGVDKNSAESQGK